jgi:hypothetical protein
MRADVGEHADERQLVEQIRRPERNAVEQVLDPLHIRRARAPDDSDDLIILLEQQLGEVRPVLTGDPGDNRALSHV